MSTTQTPQDRKVPVKQGRTKLDVRKVSKSLPQLTSSQRQTFHKIDSVWKGLWLMSFGYDPKTKVLVCEVSPRWEREDTREGSFRLGRTYDRLIGPDGDWYQEGLSKGSKTGLDSVSRSIRPKLISDLPFTVRSVPTVSEEVPETPKDETPKDETPKGKGRKVSTK